MSKQQTPKSANKIKWVETWIYKARHSSTIYRIAAKKYDSYRWICEIELPLIKKTIKSISTDEVNAMTNAADKAAKIIKANMAKYPKIKCCPLSRLRHWEIVKDEDGFVSVHLKDEYSKKLRAKVKKINEESVKAVSKTISRVKRLNGIDKNIFIQVIDRSLFKKDATKDQIFEEITDTLYYKHNIFIDTITCECENNHVIIVGYALPRQEFEKFFKKSKQQK